MKKENLIFLLIAVFLILLTNFAIAAEDPKVDKAYSCLEDKVKDACSSLSVEEQAFAALAAGKCASELEDKSTDGKCWPDSGCRLRDTSLAVLAFNRVGKSTDDAEAWLLNQTKSPTELTWYLEIDANEKTTCDINGKTIIIGEDKKINAGAGTCLSLAQDNYWLKIKNTCYETNFTISCDKDFKTTLLYQKTNGQTIYVSSKTNSASAGGQTEERVNSFCLKQGTSCDYEGSLWAALALAKTGNDISQFLPYLIAMAEDNEKYFPSAFLYIITNYDEYFTQVINEQKNDYWKISNLPYAQFYDTALALLSLYGSNAEQADTAKTYLLANQDTKGCWHDNTRDTAFILYAAWPKSVSVAPGEPDYCEPSYSCVSPLDCSLSDKLDNFYCSGGDVCCKTKPAEQTCSDKEGIICSVNQVCTGSEVPASDTSACCKGSCIVQEEPTCEKESAGYACRTSCLDTEDEKSSFTCSGGDVCCAPKPVTKSYWWLWLLIILIILIVIAILLRNQLRVWLFRAKSGFRRGPAPSSSRPSFPPSSPPMMPRVRPRMIFPQQPQRPGMIRRAVSKTDKELEDTLKKLKEMSR